MISKEVAAKIWDCYQQIEQGQKMLKTLKESINEQGEFELAKDWTGQKRGLELHIPCGNSSGSYSIEKVPLEVGLEVIKNHIKNSKAELKKLKTLCKTQLA